jgi:hypothetical protein
MRSRTAVTATLLAGLVLPVAPAASYADPPATMAFGEQVYSVALGQGQLYYTSYTGGSLRLMLRTVSRPLELGPEQQLTTVQNAAVSASSGRVVFDHRARTYVGGGIRMMGENATLGREASGNRALVQDWNGPLLEQTKYADLYDAKTQKVRNTGTPSPDLPQPPPVWPQGPQDVYGNYFLRARPDGSVVRRDWQTGRELVVRAAGTAIVAVAVHGPWVAWVTGCPGPALCTQTVTMRNLSSGLVRSVTTRGTFSLDISGADLAYDAMPGDWSTRELRTVRLGGTTVTTLSQLPEYPERGMGADMFGSAPRHFDVEDELVAWIGRDGLGHVTAMAPSIDPPRYLGNAIAPASFGTRWAIAVPVSKALPVCTATIYRGSAKVRILGCGNTIGMVSVVWDGRTGSGAVLPKGRYAYRITGRDDDGYWLRQYDGTLTAIGGTITKTS